MAPAIARVDGMPLRALIFLHSERADGCNARRALPPVSSDLENRVKAMTSCTSGPPTAADAIEDEVQEAFTIRGGDAIAALRITGS